MNKYTWRKGLLICFSLVLVFFILIASKFFQKIEITCNKVLPPNTRDTTDAWIKVNAFIAHDSSQIVLTDDEVTMLARSKFSQKIHDFSVCFLENKIVFSSVVETNSGLKFPLVYTGMLTKEKNKFKLMNSYLQIGESSHIPLVSDAISQLFETKINQRLNSFSLLSSITIEISGNKLYLKHDSNQ